MSTMNLITLVVLIVVLIAAVVVIMAFTTGRYSSHATIRRHSSQTREMSIQPTDAQAVDVEEFSNLQPASSVVLPTPVQSGLLPQSGPPHLREEQY